MRAIGGRTFGQVCQEGDINRFTGALLIVVLTAGCAAPSDSSKEDVRKQTASAADKQEDNQVINTQSGNATGFSLEGAREPRWKVQWQSARLILTPDGNSITEMKGASGSLMQKGKEASTFTSDSGKSNKVTGDIDASGQVVVVSLTRDATLRCDHIHYASKGKEVVVATGHVRVQGKWGAVSDLNELWATPDLKVFGTPDLFQKR